MPAYSKCGSRAPGARRRIRETHRAITYAVRTGKLEMASRILDTAPATYRAVVALLCFQGSACAP